MRQSHIQILLAVSIVITLVGVHQYISSATPTQAAVFTVSEDPNDSSDPMPESY